MPKAKVVGLADKLNKLKGAAYAAVSKIMADDGGKDVDNVDEDEDEEEYNESTQGVAPEDTMEEYKMVDWTTQRKSMAGDAAGGAF